MSVVPSHGESTNLNPMCTLSRTHAGFLELDKKKAEEIVTKGLISDYYDVEPDPFARGKFAVVRKCRHKKTKIEYAAKFIRKRRRLMDVRHEVLHEVAVLLLTKDSERIVNLHEVYEAGTEIILVLELASGGELQKTIDEEIRLTERDVVRLMRQILEGLYCLHQYQIAHLDLKPQNLLLTEHFPRCDVRLCDFGISRVIRGGMELREILGTPDYVAPEVLSYEPISMATDVWSVGVLAYVLLTGHSPFGGDTKQETFCNIAQGNLDFPDDLFEDVSEQAMDFIRETVVVDPSERLTTKECLQHPWFQTPSISSWRTFSHPTADCNKENAANQNHIFEGHFTSGKLRKTAAVDGEPVEKLLIDKKQSIFIK